MSSSADSAQAPASSYSTRSGLSKTWRTVKTHAAIIDAETGELQRTLQQDIEDEEAKESFVVFAVRPGKKNQLVTAGRNLLLRVWDLDTFKCVRTIKAHETPVLAMGFDPSGTLLATGGSDRAVKVFDVDKGFCTHNFRGHAGIVTLVQFHPDATRLQLVSASDDSTVRVWDLYTQKQVACIQDHMSLVTSVAFSEDGYTMLSAGRDKVVNFWDLRDQKLSKTVLVHEAVEGLVVVPSSFKCVKANKTQDDKAIYFITAGEKGLLRLWQSSGSSCETLYTQKSDASSALTYMDLLLSTSRREIVVISSEQNFLVFDEKLARRTQIIGYNDDILNLKYIPKADASGEPSDMLAVATNSEQIRLLNRETLSCELLSGHTDIVMALAVSPDGRWLDKLIKVWHSQQAGAGRLLTLAGVCRGHKRGVWAVEFSPVDQCLASASGDKTVKVWSAKDFSCLKTFEGHTASVLNVQFACAGMQLLSAGADGLVKLWTIKSNECEATLDNHEDKIWALAVAKDSSEMVSGGADSAINLWKDFTEEEERAQQDDRDAKLLKEQELFNCLRNNKLLDAVQLAFELNHPNRMLQIFRDLLEGPRHKDQPTLPGGKPIDPDNFAPEDIFAPVVLSLEDEQLTTLMEWLRDWNTNARNTGVCQVLVSTILRELPPSRIKALEGAAKTVEALIAYSERHFQRIDRMLQKSYLVDFSIVTMKSLLPVGESLSAVEKTDSDSEVEEPKPVETKQQVKEPKPVKAKQQRKRGKVAATGKAKKQRV
eukprot:jgi/Phyca11/13487/fgenesh1_pg.PHYCAscaffold_4_\